MKNVLRLKITFVDLYGYCGREYHPEPSDVGVSGIVVGVQTWILDPADDSMDLVSDPDTLGTGRVNPVFAKFPVRDREQLMETYFRIVTDDNRLLDVVNHEVEVEN